MSGNISGKENVKRFNMARSDEDNIRRHMLNVPKWRLELEKDCNILCCLSMTLPNAIVNYKTTVRILLDVSKLLFVLSNC